MMLEVKEGSYLSIIIIIISTDPPPTGVCSLCIDEAVIAWLKLLVSSSVSVIFNKEIIFEIFFFLSDNF